MLLLIHERDRWELPPEPEPEPTPDQREFRIPRPTKGAIKLTLALVLLIAGMLASGIFSDALMLIAVVTLFSAAGTLMPYGLGLKEHHQ